MKMAWPAIVIIIIIGIFYFPFFKQGLRPIPGDITPGMYYPWFDYKFPEFPNNIPVKNPLPSDVVSLTYPLRLLSINLIKDRQLPLWNSLILCGTPLLANFQSAALYPLNILYIFSNNFSLIWSWQVISQLIIGLFFTFWFLRSHNLNRISSLFGAIIWATGSFFSIWGQYNTVIHAIVYLPLALMSVKKMTVSRIWGLGLVIAISFSIYAGNPPMTLIMLMTLGIYSMIQIKFELKKYFPLIFFGCLALGVAAPLLIPGITNSGLSVRGSDTVAVDNNIKFLPIRQIITLVSPDFFGNPTTLNHWAPGLYDNLTIFVGVVPAMLFLLSFYITNSSQRQLTIFARIIFFGTFVLMTENPLSKVIGSLPVLGLSSMVMSRFFAVTSFAIAISSAIVIDRITTTEVKIKYWFIYIFLFALILTPLTIATINFLVFKYGYQFTTQIPPASVSAMAIVIQNTMTSIRNSFIPLFIFSVSSMGLILLTKKNKYIVVIILLILTTLDSYRFFKKYNTFVPEKYLYPQNASLDYLQKNSTRFIREGGELLPSNMWMPYDLKSASGYDTLHSARYNGFISLLNGSSLQNTTNRYVELDNTNSSYINFLGISDLIALKRIDGIANIGGSLSHKIDLTRYTKAFEDKSVVILRNASAMPLVFPVSSFIVSQNISQANDLIKNNDLTKTVILDSDPHILISKILPVVSNTQYKPQQTTLDVQSSGDSLLVTSQSYDPGWRLKIDGYASQILIANHAFMAFKVPSGAHHLSLEYQPESFYLGLKILAASLLVVFIILVIYSITISKHFNRSKASGILNFAFKILFP